MMQSEKMKVALRQRVAALSPEQRRQALAVTVRLMKVRSLRGERPGSTIGPPPRNT